MSTDNSNTQQDQPVQNAQTHPQTAQEVFDIVYKHLLTQNERCYAQRAVLGVMEQACVYENDKGQRCAIGALLIGDEYAEARKTPYAVPELIRQHKRVCGWMLPFEGLLVSLQDAHDMYSVPEWRERLHQIAERHNLTVPTL